MIGRICVYPNTAPPMHSAVEMKTNGRIAFYSRG